MITLQPMKRDIFKKLAAWKRSDRRKPLILQGARQTGKTYALQAFERAEYIDSVYCNFETNIDLKEFFSQNIQPDQIIRKLNIYFGKNIQPGRTLIIFDEIQACPEALNSLKYFHEQATQFHIAAAGSLLGVKLNQIKSFPVGQVNFLNLFPLSFLEFLDAMQQGSLRAFLEDIQSPESITPLFHNKLIEQLKLYFYIGGMPEAVASFVKKNDFSLVRDIHQEILKSYELDFSKHAEKSDVIKISEVWN